MMNAHSEIITTDALEDLSNAEGRLQTLLTRRFPHVDVPEFFEQLYKNTIGVIAGPVVAQCILDVPWSEECLDIWIPSNTFPPGGPVKDKDTRLTLHDLPQELKKIREVFSCFQEEDIEHKYEEATRTRLWDFVDVVVSLRQPGQSTAVRLLGLGNWNQWEPAIAAFDIEAHQIAYDGRDFLQIVTGLDHTPLQLLQRRLLTISSIAASFHRNIDEWIETLERLKEYRLPNFQICWTVTIFDMFCETLSRDLLNHPRAAVIVDRWNTLQSELTDIDPKYIPVELEIIYDEDIDAKVIQGTFWTHLRQYPLSWSKMLPAQSQCYNSISFDNFSLPLEKEDLKDMLILLPNMGESISCMDREYLRRQIEDHGYRKEILCRENDNTLRDTFLKLSTDFGDFLTYLPDVQAAYESLVLEETFASKEPIVDVERDGEVEKDREVQAFRLLGSGWIYNMIPDDVDELRCIFIGYKRTYRLVPGKLILKTSTLADTLMS